MKEEWIMEVCPHDSMKMRSDHMGIIGIMLSMGCCREICTFFLWTVT